MSLRIRIAVLSLLMVPATATAQHGAGEAPTLVTVAPAEAKQFSFLVGQWELDVRPVMSALAQAVHGQTKYVGTWKAWPALDGWGVVDELRMSDESGNPKSFTHTVRTYDATLKHWNSATLDVYHGAFLNTVGESKSSRDGQEVVVTGSSIDAQGVAYLTRMRFYDIKPNGFRADSERSTDSGKTWTATRRIVAKRIAASAPR